MCTKSQTFLERHKNSSIGNMRVLIVEPRNTGHHISYVEKAVDALSVLGELTLCSPLDSAQHPDWRDRILPLQDRIECKCCLPAFDFSKPTISWSRILQAIVNLEPNQKLDLIYFPSGDYLQYIALTHRAMWQKFRNWLDSGKIMVGLPTFHLTPTLHDLAKRRVRRYFLKLSSIDLFLTQSRQISKWSQSLALVPEPTTPLKMQGISKRECRMRLGIKTNGPLCVMAGVLERRGKGLRPFLKEFVSIDSGDPTELLLAGEISRSTLAWISDLACENFSNCKIHFRTYRSDQELHECIGAGDLTVVPYGKHYMTSAIASASIALRRPIYAPKIGWFEQVIKETDCGYFISEHEPLVCGDELPDIARTACSYTPSEANIQYGKYTSNENYASLLREASERICRP